jgi:hypothetical protein
LPHNSCVPTVAVAHHDIQHVVGQHGGLLTGPHQRSSCINSWDCQLVRQVRCLTQFQINKDYKLSNKELVNQQNDTTIKLIKYMDLFQLTVEHNAELTTDCIRGSATFPTRFIERTLQQMIINRQQELQQDAIEVEATENEGNTDTVMMSG